MAASDFSRTAGSTGQKPPPYPTAPERWYSNTVTDNQHQKDTQDNPIAVPRQSVSENWFGNGNLSKRTVFMFS